MKDDIQILSYRLENLLPHGQVVALHMQGTLSRLEEACYVGIWDHEIRPIRNMISRIRFKLKDFGIEILSLLETGYLLEIARKDQEPS